MTTTGQESPMPQASTVRAPGVDNKALADGHQTTNRTVNETATSELDKLQAATEDDLATAAFVRRTLCSHTVLLGSGEKGRGTPRPIDELLPPLTSSNAIDLQLYAIISVIIKEFVQSWYSKITPDQEFVNETIQIIAHCTRGLEQRLRKVDLEALILDEIPELLHTHLAALRLAKQQADNPSCLVSDSRALYHALNPHPALSPVPSEAVSSSVAEQRENESAWRQLLVQGVLAVLLPTEDLENSCLRTLVSEVFAEMILGNGISGKACEGWLLWEAITNIVEVLRGGRQQLDSASLPPYGPIGEKSGQRSTRSMSQSGSTKTSTSASRDGSVALALAFVSRLLRTFGHYIVLAGTAFRMIALTIGTMSSLPMRSGPGASTQSSAAADLPWQTGQTMKLDSKRPMVSMKLWSCASQLVELDMRMPWLSGFASLLRWLALAGPGRVGDTDGALDRFLSHTIRSRLLNPSVLPKLLGVLRASLFPNNTLGPARKPPSAEEAKRIRRDCAAALLGLLPAKVACIYFASESEGEQLEQVETMLSCLDDAYVNKHLIFAIVELVVVRLMPELGERGVQELLEERIG